MQIAANTFAIICDSSVVLVLMFTALIIMYLENSSIWLPSISFGSNFTGLRSLTSESNDNVLIFIRRKNRNKRMVSVTCSCD
jgi:hypothetical protein